MLPPILTIQGTRIDLDRASLARILRAELLSLFDIEFGDQVEKRL